MSFPDHFSDRADAYARSRPTYPPALLDFLSELIPNAHRVWEPGCGSGQLSTLLGQRFPHVVSTDASAEQLLRAPAGPSVTYHCALAELSGLANSSADMIVVAQAVHWFDLQRFYTEVKRVAHKRAPIVLLSYGHTRVEPSIDEHIIEFHEFLLRGYWPPERAHVDAEYRTLHFPFAEVSVPAIRMTSQWDLHGFLGYVDTWSGVRALLNARGAEKLDHFKRAVTSAWGAPETIRSVHWPLAIRAGRV